MNATRSYERPSSPSRCCPNLSTKRQAALPFRRPVAAPSSMSISRDSAAKVSPTCKSFCFDLMLTEMNIRRGRGPGFLIHDSHLFDGVDERQVAKALQLGAE